MDIFHRCEGSQDLKQLPQHMVLTSRMNGALPTGYFYFHHFNKMTWIFFNVNINGSFHILQCSFIQHTKQIPVGHKNTLHEI